MNRSVTVPEIVLIAIGLGSVGGLLLWGYPPVPAVLLVLLVVTAMITTTRLQPSSVWHTVVRMVSAAAPLQVPVPGAPA